MAQLEKKDTSKILSVVWFKVFPPKFGGQKAVAFFNEYLNEHLALVCICSKNNEDISSSYPVHRSLPVSGLQFLNPFVWRKMYTVAKKEDITHLILEFPYHGIAGFLCKKLLKIKLVINTHNIEFLRFKEQKKWWWGPLFHFEKWVLKNADAVFFKTDADKEAARNYFGLKEEKAQVVPYGVDEKKNLHKNEAGAILRQRYAIRKEEKILLFAGTLDYAPNAEAVEFIAGKLVPQLNLKSVSYKVIICGRNRMKAFQYLNNLGGKEIIFAGDVADIETYFAGADLFINPVASGGGIQTKIMDALSYHLNVVCFQSKALQIYHAPNKLFVVADNDPDSFTGRVIKAMNHNEPTPPAFFETYHWRTIAAKASQKIISL